LSSHLRNSSAQTLSIELLCHYYYLLPWYFISRVVKLVNVEMYVRNGYSEDITIIIIVIISIVTVTVQLQLLEF